MAEFYLVPSALVLTFFLDPLMFILIPCLAVNYSCPFDNRWWSTEPRAWEEGETLKSQPFERRGPGTLFSRVSTHTHSKAWSLSGKLQPFCPSGICREVHKHLLGAVRRRVSPCIELLNSDKTLKGSIMYLFLGLFIQECIALGM